MNGSSDAAGPAAMRDHLALIQADLQQLTLALLFLAAVALVTGALFRRHWSGKLALIIGGIALVSLALSGWMLWSTQQSMGGS